MTDQQEIILDRLIGTEKIGPYWSTGPIGLAVLALNDKKWTNKRDASQALGYPNVLCHAIQGASSFLKQVDDRRKLAVTIFTDVPPRPHVMRIPRRRSVEIAVWCAFRVHPLVHKGKCALGRTVTRRCKGYLEDGLETDENSLSDNLRDCPAGLEERRFSSGWENSIEGSGFGSMHYTAEVIDCAARTGRGMGNYLNLVGRDSARVPALEKGVAGAIEFCVSLARQLTM